jgi:prepilin-type N-terminal cleavage/methylation domain-containing protein
MTPAKPNRWQSQGPGARSAFSLIELLVVIAIIAILAALLLPVINRAQNQGAKATDLSNLRQIMMAVRVYADDNKDIMPWPNWDYGTTVQGVAVPGWLYTINTATSGPARFNPQTSLLWDSLHSGGGTKVFLCPMDNPAQVYPPPQGKTQTQTRAQQISTYIMNGAVIGFRTGYQSNSAPVKISQMLPTDCILFEADERTAFAYNDGSSWPSEGVTTRHFYGATQGLLDGSASYIRDDDWLDLINDPNKNSVWCYPLSDDGGDPENGHENWNWSP